MYVTTHFWIAVERRDCSVRHLVLLPSHCTAHRLLRQQRAIAEPIAQPPSAISCLQHTAIANICLVLKQGNHTDLRTPISVPDALFLPSTSPSGMMCHAALRPNKANEYPCRSRPQVERSIVAGPLVCRVCSWEVNDDYAAGPCRTPQSD